MKLLHMVVRASAAFLMACTATYGAEGLVLDKTTGKPIPRAVVLVTWNGVVRLAVQPASHCYQAEVVVTDDSGRFQVPTFSGNINPFMADRHREVTVLAAGFRESPDSNDLHVLMEPQTGTKSEQFKHLPGIQATGCLNVDRRIFLPYLQALHAQMSALAETTEEKLKVSSVLAAIDYIELGDIESLKRSSQRRSSIKSGSR